MDLKPISNPLNERVLRGVHDSGLAIVLAPKPQFSKAFGVFATNFGSVDNRFADPLSGAAMAVPDGVAHFLEHKMFEDASGDVSDRFSRLGAMSNASTGFTTTSYVFSSTDHVLDCLDLLLDFVQEPWFTPDTVAKEQGIIGQEIRMYDDDPSWRIFFNLMQALYRVHPVRINIAGTEASIAAIDPGVLHACHRAFYRPGNMCLALAGNFDPAAALERIERDLAGRKMIPGGRHRRSPADDGPITAPEASEPMDVARPKLLLGWKDLAIGGDGRDLDRRELLSGMVLDLLFGRSSQVHENLYRDGLIDDSFAAQYSGEIDFGFTIAGGDVDEPDRAAERLVAEVDGFLARGIDEADFRRIRAKYLGQTVSLFDSLETIAYASAAGEFRGVTLFDNLVLLESIRPEELARRAREMFRHEYRARSLIVPRAAAP